MPTTSPSTTTPTPDTAWAVETSTSGPGIADDHINLKTDSSGRVFAATKTSLSGRVPSFGCSFAAPGGSWVIHVFGTGTNGHTRPIVLLDQAGSLIRMYATSRNRAASSTRRRCRSLLRTIRSTSRLALARCSLTTGALI